MGVTKSNSKGGAYQKAPLGSCPNIKDKEVEIFIIRQGRSTKAKALGWVKLTFQVKEQKFAFEKAASEWRKKKNTPQAQGQEHGQQLA